MRARAAACAAGIVIATFAAACGSPAAPTLYTPVSGNRPSLRDGEIRMTTYWTTAPEEVPDVRAVTCVDGVITAWFEGKAGRREGPVNEAEWNDLWARLEPVAPWSATPYTLKPNDPSGGPYHVVAMRAGEQASQFSSQMRADLLVFSSREVSDRLKYTNIVVDFVACHARTLVTLVPEAPATPAPTTP